MGVAAESASRPRSSTSPPLPALAMGVAAESASRPRSSTSPPLPALAMGVAAGSESRPLLFPSSASRGGRAAEEVVEAGERDVGALGVGDRDRSAPDEGGDGGGHRDAMVAVRVDGRAAETRRSVDDEPVGKLLDTRSETSEHLRHHRDAIALLAA